MPAAVRSARRADSDADWRPGLRKEIAWLLAAKFAALVLLWALFFR